MPKEGLGKLIKFYREIVSDDFVEALVEPRFRS